jgi:hypothetical protein
VSTCKPMKGKAALDHSGVASDGPAAICRTSFNASNKWVRSIQIS